VAQHSWTRDEDLAVLYCRLRYEDTLKKSHPDIRTLAEAMRCPGENDLVGSVWERKRNFDYPDTEKGRANAARQTKEVWQQYELDPSTTYLEAHQAWQRVTKQEG
jgi:hypothetical protein